MTASTSHQKTDHLETAEESERLRLVSELRDTLDALVWRSLQLGAGVLKQYELTLPQAMALGAITRLGPAVDMGRVVEATGLPASTTTSVVDRLVQRGLVSRGSHPADRRRVQVSATRSGSYLQDEMDCHDLNTWTWLSRDVSTNDLTRILAAFERFRQQLEEATVDDFNRLRRPQAADRSQDAH